MRKLLRPQDILLLGLANVLDVFEELKDPFKMVSKSYENMYGWTPKKFWKNGLGDKLFDILKLTFCVIKPIIPIHHGSYRKKTF